MFNLEDILPKFPVFASLDKGGIKELAQISCLREFKKGEIIYCENGLPDNLYIVVSGRVKTYTEASLKENRIIEYLHRGTCFGIISLLTNEPHSVTTEAANDTLIALIPIDKFSEFLNKYPVLAIEFSRLLSRRVKKRADKEKNIFESQIISVYSHWEKSGKTSYSLALAAALEKESGKKVIVIELKSDKHAFFFPSADKVIKAEEFNEDTFANFLERRQAADYIRLYYRPESNYALKNIPLCLSFLTQTYSFIIIDLPAAEDALIILFLLQSDLIHFLCASELAKPAEIQRAIEDLENNYKIKHDAIKVIAREPALSLPEGHCILATLPRPEEQAYAKAIRKLARELSAARTGLALGSGAAFGLAHIGVLKVLEKQHIDIDMVSGSSLGSIIAALWGLGKDWAQIRELVSEFESFPVFSFSDIGFSKRSVFKGHHLRKTLKRIFRDATFFDLKKPVLIVSFDFLRRQPHIFSQQNILIRDAVLASCAMPGVFEPLKDKSDLFLDGGILNPLPVGCLVKEGIKKIISVNVTPSKEEIEQAYRQDTDVKKLNILDFIFGSVEAMQREFIEAAASLSDVVIHPAFKNALWTEFKKIDYFIEEGERATLQQLDNIKQLQEI